MPQQYPVQFPLARPSLDNLQAICLHSDHRPRYPDSYFPPSGFGAMRRRASAVNNAESWFSTCCHGNQTWGMDVTLCCATQAVSLTFCKCKIRTRHLASCHPRSVLLLLFLIGLIIMQQSHFLSKQWDIMNHKMLLLSSVINRLDPKPVWFPLNNQILSLTLKDHPVVNVWSVTSCTLPGAPNKQSLLCMFLY